MNRRLSQLEDAVNSPDFTPGGELVDNTEAYYDVLERVYGKPIPPEERTPIIESRADYKRFCEVLNKIYGKPEGTTWV